MMKFTINDSSNNLAIVAIVYKLIYISLSYLVPEFYLDTQTFIFLHILSYPVTAYLYFYLKNFSNQIMNYSRLDFSLSGIGLMMMLFMVKEILIRVSPLDFSNLKNSYYIFFIAIIMVILDVMLFVGILKIPGGLFKKHFSLFGLFTLIQMIVTFSFPIILLKIQYTGHIKPEDFRFYVDFILDIFRLVPFLVLFPVIFSYGKSVVVNR